MTTDLRAAMERVLPGVREDLERLVRIPSVSVDPAAADHVQASAEAVAELLRGCGLQDVQVLAVDGGAPAVVGHRPAPPGRPTVLLYAHHDVQPTGDLDGWRSPPFEPTERDGRLYGRGVTDDKAGVMAHVAALRAFDGEPPVGVTVFIEGEEEIGSPTLGAFLAKYRDLLAADVMVLADSANWAVGTPALTTSLRGLVDCVVEVRTLDHPVHSGTYGGVVLDALTSLCRLFATLHDERGNVAVAGITAGPAAPLELSEDHLRAEAGILDGVQLIGEGSIVERMWTRPSVSVLAIDTTRVQDASNTLVPSARAKVSMRIPPGQDAKDAMEKLTAHLLANAPFGAQVTVTPGAIGEAYQIAATGPAFDIARSALREAWDGAEPVDMGVGGTVPFIAEFASAYPKTAILVTGVGEPESGAHGYNESLHLGEFARVCLGEAMLFDKLAGMYR